MCGNLNSKIEKIKDLGEKFLSHVPKADDSL